MPEQKVDSKVHRPLYDATRMILLAAVGAASLAQDELSGVLDRLVERGEMAEADARKMMREMIDRREKLARERKSQKPAAESAAPSADVEALNARVAELSRQIEELKKEKAA